jgi:rhodanese-related sulfurtransferase
MEFKRVTPEEAKKLIDDEGYHLLDVRSIPEYAREHPAGAYNIPFLHKTAGGMVSNPDFTRMVQGLFADKSAKIVTTCGTKTLWICAAVSTVSAMIAEL